MSRASRTPGEASPADGTGLVVDYPVFNRVSPPTEYLDAIDHGTRSLDGRPGPLYWQQRVDYRIDAELEPETARLTGSETITVHNETPYRRFGLILRLYQNVFSEGVARNMYVSLTGGMEVERLTADGVALTEREPPRFRRAAPPEPEPGYSVRGTLATVILPTPLEPGATMQLEVDWSFTVSGGGGFRSGHLDGEVFNIAQWYPQVAVFDDVFGQDYSEYLGRGEFYDDYGDYDVSITVPQGWIVVGTGTLLNSAEVLRREAVERLQAARTVDTVVSVVSTSDRDAGRATAASESARLTWRFAAENVRDFAFATSNRYVWDATGAETGHDGGRALIQNVYDPAVEYWAEATLYAKHAIEFFSDYILPYPYPQATTAYGPPEVGGMEYPMITFINRSREGRGLHSTVSHELSHFWMPMIIGSKEMAYAWMDEGLTVFNNSLSMQDFYGSLEEDLMEQYHRAVATGPEVPIMHHSDHTESFFRATFAAYRKPAILLHALRHMLGEETFDGAYRDYARAWAFKHPMPWDFFAMMEEAAGVDLDWFWQPWFYGTASLDQAVEAVETIPGGLRVTVSNLSDGVMPVEIDLELSDGRRKTVVWPVALWAGTRRITREIQVGGRVQRVTIDPDGHYPDLDRSNNEWTNAH